MNRQSSGRPANENAEPSEISDGIAANSNDNGMIAAVVPQPSEENVNSNVHTPVKRLVWTWPWVVSAIFLYVFILFWMNYAILRRYWIKHLWNEALPGLDKSYLRKFTMRMHMTAGAISILLGPIQFISYLRRNKRWSWVHRYTGRLYCVCGMLSSIFGLWFISLKRRLVGGYNMSISFALAGAFIGILSWKAWQTARAAKFGTATSADKSRAFVTHRNWAIRSYFQTVAPALYRYWYIMMTVFNMYKIPTIVGQGGYCDSRDFCPAYARPWDAIYTWLYWVSAGVVAEIIIYFLPSHDSSFEVTTEVVPRDGMNSEGLTTPLLSASTNITTGGSVSETQNVPSESARSETIPAQSVDDKYAFVVNGVGCFLAVVTVATTSTMFYDVLAKGEDI